MTRFPAGTGTHALDDVDLVQQLQARLTRALDALHRIACDANEREQMTADRQANLRQAKAVLVQEGR